MSNSQPTTQIITGTVSQIIFYQENDGYTVLAFTPSELLLGHGTSITAVGYMPEYFEDEELQLEGTWSVHSRYGEQFKVIQSRRILPVTVHGIQRFLQSGILPGVGKRIAAYIVEKFGTDTIAMLDSVDAETQLASVPYVSANAAIEMIKAWRSYRDNADNLVFLHQYNIGHGTAMRIIRHYKMKHLNLIKELQTNPYQLIEIVPGIAFLKADEIARRMGMAANSPYRIRAAINHTLKEATYSGHVFLPKHQLLRKSQILLQFDETPLVEEVIEGMINTNILKVLVMPDPTTPNQTIEALYAPALYHLEKEVARAIQHRFKHDEGVGSALGFTNYEFTQDVTTRLNLHLTDNNFQLSDAQKVAILATFETRLAVITGGPGTGKTTIMRFLIALFEDYDISYLLASPTGRAAKRLTQTTDREAQTIHRMLIWNPTGFFHSKENPLDTDVVVIDESSMLDIYLFHSLLYALKPTTSLVLIGDVDQLPSVGPGNVLRDVIQSIENQHHNGTGSGRVTRLEKIFRQGKNSLITQNAHLINQGKPLIIDGQGDDFFMFQVDDPDEAANILVDVVVRRIPEKFNYNPIKDIQVLAPMYRHSLGVDALNQALQAKLNPVGPTQLRVGQDKIFRLGDKVMQTKNNYDTGVYNGDIGFITEIDAKAQWLLVQMDEDVVKYELEDVEQELTLAYACTVHRAQGSEYPVVVMAVSTQHYVMLQRNLLYTGVTRAKDVVVLVGTRRAVTLASQNNRLSQRWSNLPWRIANLDKEANYEIEPL